ncbi:chemotaxis protein CheA [Tautonia rosea]|uniref:chemotaxis protein CheA n=1 Tax=Tautonia rosea TaxID=2728037 RepID=UPI001475191F|nr:chemotaxis protein CheA [Tautonia rosea]
MSGFDVSELLPFYLDETDEQIGTLNDTLLRLEQDQSDAAALQETFRIVHSLKGSASVMGFDQVNRLAHHLETLFDQLRSGKRLLDFDALQLSFQSLDRLRDYHRDLRSEGKGDDLSDMIEAVVSYLGADQTTPSATSGDEIEPPLESTDLSDLDDLPMGETSDELIDTPPETVSESSDSASEIDEAEQPEGLAVKVVFVPTLQWRDMKARLILNRLSSRVRVLGSDPPADRLDEVESRSTFTAWVDADADRDELRSLADVDGVAAIQFGDGADGSEEVWPSEETVPPLLDVPELVAKTDAPALSPERAAPTEMVLPKTTTKPKIAETLRVDVDRLDHLMNLAGELVISRARFADLTRELEALFRDSDVRLLAADSQDRLDCLIEGFDAVLDSGERSQGIRERWRSQFRRLTENIRELRANLDRLRIGRDHLTEMAEAIDQLGRVCDRIQKGVLDTRMVPIGPLFERFRRVVRDVSVGSGKDVTLQIQGESTELDKRMIDELSDPLIHMVRNAVDHGLEAPGVRQSLGKPKTGTVTLAAAHRGNRVVITVADDGKGLDVARLRRKIAAHGLLPEAEAARLSPPEVIPYIFHAGLSTADTVSDISGRGVGMDVVKHRIEQLNGTVFVRTEPGQGTTFTIRLPLTLAIMPSLLVRIYDETYALPLGEIREIVEVGPDQILNVQGSRAIEVRGRVISLLCLDDVFSWGGGPHPSRSASSSLERGSLRRPVVVVQSTLTTIGLMVDDLIGIQEIVLKSIERNYRTVRGLSGASILGNGRVALILDVDALIELSTRPSHHLPKHELPSMALSRRDS